MPAELTTHDFNSAGSIGGTNIASNTALVLEEASKGSTPACLLYAGALKSYNIILETAVAAARVSYIGDAHDSCMSPPYLKERDTQVDPVTILRILSKCSLQSKYIAA